MPEPKCCERSRSTLDLPLRHRPRWIGEQHPEIRTDLVYLAWGLRDYGGHPTSPPPQKMWSYILIQQGTPTIALPDGPLRLAPNQSLIVSVHRGFTWCDELNARARLLVWLWRTPPVIASIRPPPGGYRLGLVNQETRRRLELLHAACRKELDRPDQYLNQSLKALHHLVSIEFARALEAVDSESDAQLRARLAARWLQQHLGTPNAIFLLCDYLQISPATLKRLFAETLGESPWGYYQRLRMQQAKEMLRNRKLTVKEIAGQLGYKHPNDFSRAYKAFHGAAARRV